PSATTSSSAPAGISSPGTPSCTCSRTPAGWPNGGWTRHETSRRPPSRVGRRKFRRAARFIPAGVGSPVKRTGSNTCLARSFSLLRRISACGFKFLEPVFQVHYAQLVRGNRRIGRRLISEDAHPIGQFVAADIAVRLGFLLAIRLSRLDRAP